jgi:hypothetical protein
MAIKKDTLDGLLAGRDPVIIGVIVIAAVVVNFLNVGLEALLGDGWR